MREPTRQILYECWEVGCRAHGRTPAPRVGMVDGEFCPEHAAKYLALWNEHEKAKREAFTRAAHAVGVLK